MFLHFSVSLSESFGSSAVSDLCLRNFYFKFKKKTNYNVLYWMSQKMFMHFVGCGIESMRQIFKTEMLIYQSKAMRKFCVVKLLII